ncbi:hypothetical protein BVRB_7g164360 [Beta vulgaris subsp. vulgaris]|nr:hypothetical protein BVRB_7g164360 [Beta vulgaris subsp. vulgaris]
MDFQSHLAPTSIIFTLASLYLEPDIDGIICTTNKHLPM